MNISKWLGISAGLVAMAVPVSAFSQISPARGPQLHNVAWQDQDDHRRRDDDDDRRDNRQNGQYGQYGQYGNRGYGRYGRGGNYQGVLAPEWQSKFDSYYQRWLQYRSSNNQSEAASMERRMQDIMRNYNIPANTPYGAVASAGIGGNNGGYYGRGGYGRRGDNDGDEGGRGGYGNGGYGNGGYGNGGYYGNGNGRYGYHGVLAPEWQSKFDSYYQRWLQYRATNNQGEVASMEKRMQDIMRNYNIPSNVPYGQVASAGIGGNRY